MRKTFFDARMLVYSSFVQEFCTGPYVQKLKKMYIMHVQKHLYKRGCTSLLHVMAYTELLYRRSVTGPMYNDYYVHKKERPV